MADRRAQSEVLGLVVVFSIVVAAVGIVAATGFAGLQDARHVEAANNGVRAFEILDDNVDDLVRGRATDRATDLALADAQLSVGDPITIEVRATRVADGTTVSFAREVRPIEYDLGDGTRLVYVAGALVREEHLGAVLLREPTLVLTADAALVPVVQTRAPAYVGVGGDRSVTLRTHLADTSVLLAETEPHRLELSVTSPHPAVWERYFADLPHDAVTVTGDTVVTDLGVVDRVTVTVAKVDVTVE